MVTNWTQKIPLHKYQGRIQGGGRTRRPPNIGKNMTFLHKIVIFHTKYPKNFRASLRSARFFLSEPPNLKPWIRSWAYIVGNTGTGFKQTQKYGKLNRLVKFQLTPLSLMTGSPWQYITNDKYRFPPPPPRHSAIKYCLIVFIVYK